MPKYIDVSTTPLFVSNLTYTASNNTNTFTSNVAITGNTSISGNVSLARLPTSTVTPTTSTQLTTKAYVDSLSGVTVAGTNAFTGTNTFNTNLPTSTVTPTTGTQLTTKTYVDSITTNQTYASSNNTTTFAGNVAVTGNTSVSKNILFTTVAPTTCSIQMNQNPIYIGLNNYASHYIKSDTTTNVSGGLAPNGVGIAGWTGVRLGSTQTGTTNILWVYGANGTSTNEAGINGKFSVLGATTLSTTLAVTGTTTLTGPLICNQIYENTTAITGTTTPFTCNMALGSSFYIPTDYTFASNFQIIITNVPTDTTKTYTISVVYRQPTTLFYINTARVSDTATTYLLGTVSTFSAPLFNGGVPTLANTPNLIIQSFSIISTATSSSTFTRYVTSSVNNHY